MKVFTNCWATWAACAVSLAAFSGADRASLKLVGEPSIVTIIVKDGPATLTASDDVADRTGELQTRRSGHREA